MRDSCPRIHILKEGVYRRSIFDIENWLWKYNFGTFWRSIIHRRIVLRQFPLSMSILGQKPCILGPTIFKIPQPNWHCNSIYSPCKGKEIGKFSVSCWSGRIWSKINRICSNSLCLAYSSKWWRCLWNPKWSQLWKFVKIQTKIR